MDRPMETSGGPNSPGRNLNSPEFSTGADARGRSDSGLDYSGGHGQASSPRPVLGPDGRRADETWSGFPSGLGAVVERNPVIVAFASLGVGLAVGIIVGAAIARD